MNIFDKLKSHKDSNLSFTLLILLVVVFTGFKVADMLDLFMVTNNIVTLLFSILTIVPPIVVIILLHNKDGVFASHFLLFILFLANYLSMMFNFNMFSGSTLSAIESLLGIFASIYVLMKLYAHRGEINKYTQQVNRNIIILIVLALIDVYLTSYFAQTMVYLVLFGAVITSMKSREALLIVLMIFIGQIIRDVNDLVIGLKVMSNPDLIVSILSIAISLYITYYTYKLYISSDTYHDERLQYYS